MKRALVLILSLLLCLLCLCACNTGGQIPPKEPAPSPENTQISPPETPEPPSAPEPISIEHLTFELVVSWGESDRLVAKIKDLSALLRDALLEQNCQVDEVTITISTAAGLTADALENGGVDLALMPAADYVSCGDSVSAVLTSSEVPCSIVLAMSGAKPELNEAFRSALTTALLESEGGNAFLTAYREDMVCVPATEESIQTLRDHVAAQEANKYGGN